MEEAILPIIIGTQTHLQQIKTKIKIEHKSPEHKHKQTHRGTPQQNPNKNKKIDTT